MQRVEENTDFNFGIGEDVRARLWDDFKESSMNSELKKIIMGGWDSVPQLDY